jgi:hypothetical protein
VNRVAATSFSMSFIDVTHLYGDYCAAGFLMRTLGDNVIDFIGDSNVEF